MPRMQNRYKKRVVGKYKPFTPTPAPTPRDNLDLIVHRSSNDDTEGDQEPKSGDGGKDST
jgi:hypothetical protein